MRTNKFFKTGLLLFVASLGLISCGDDDKEPEIVVDPVSENVEYYIEGKVVADNAALEGVSVTAGEATATTDENGQYSLTVKDKKTYTVSFAKKGYKTVSDASVEIANNATNKSQDSLGIFSFPFSFFCNYFITFRINSHSHAFLAHGYVQCYQTLVGSVVGYFH